MTGASWQFTAESNRKNLKKRSTLVKVNEYQVARFLWATVYSRIPNSAVQQNMLKCFILGNS